MPPTPDVEPQEQPMPPGEPARWHLQKGIPVALMAGLLFQLAVIIWGAASPIAVQRRYCRCTEFQLPSSHGRSRQGAPVRVIQKVASSTRRWSIGGRPPRAPLSFTKGPKNAHSSTARRPRITTGLPHHQPGRDRSPGRVPPLLHQQPMRRRVPCASAATRPARRHAHCRCRGCAWSRPSEEKARQRQRPRRRC
jgi:hypothetical protein